MSILSSLKEINKLDQIETFTAFYPNSDESENRFVEKLSKEWNFKNHSFEISPENVYNELITFLILLIILTLFLYVYQNI